MVYIEDILECIEKIEEYVKVGASYILLYLQNLQKIKPLKVFAKKVIPYFK